MLAATKVKTSGSEKEANRSTYDNSSVKLVTWKFHVQNNGNEMYKKVCCRCQVFFVFFWLIRPRRRRRRRLALHDFIFCLSKLLVY